MKTPVFWCTFHIQYCFFPLNFWGKSVVLTRDPPTYFLHFTSWISRNMIRFTVHPEAIRMNASTFEVREWYNFFKTLDVWFRLCTTIITVANVGLYLISLFSGAYLNISNHSLSWISACFPFLLHSTKFRRALWTLAKYLSTVWNPTALGVNFRTRTRRLTLFAMVLVFWGFFLSHASLLPIPQSTFHHLSTTFA